MTVLTLLKRFMTNSSLDWSIRKRLSGVVIRISGRDVQILCRSAAVESPLRTAILGDGRSSPFCAANSRISAKGVSKFSRMSLLSAFNGET